MDDNLDATYTHLIIHRPMTSKIKRPLVVTVAAWYLIGIIGYTIIGTVIGIVAGKDTSILFSVWAWIVFALYVCTFVIPCTILNGVGDSLLGAIFALFWLFCRHLNATRDAIEAGGLVFATILLYLPVSRDFFRLSAIRRREEWFSKRTKFIDEDA